MPTAIADREAPQAQSTPAPTTTTTTTTTNTTAAATNTATTAGATFTSSWDNAVVVETPKIDTFKSYDDNDRDIDSDDDEDDVVFQDMQLFLHAIGEPQLVDKFLANKVTLGQLLEFNEKDLIECGVELVGDRKKILENTGQMHNEKWQPSSLHDLTAKTMLSSPGIYIALNDINKHIEYIGVTFKYLERRLRERPEMLELGKDYVGVGKIASELEDLLKTSKTTYVHLKLLQKEIKKHANDPTKRSANLIDDEYIRQATIDKRLALLLVGPISLFIAYKLFQALTNHQY